MIKLEKSLRKTVIFMLSSLSGKGLSCGEDKRKVALRFAHGVEGVKA